jgi:hypothetical protein
MPPYAGIFRLADNAENEPATEERACVAAAVAERRLATKSANFQTDRLALVADSRWWRRPPRSKHNVRVARDAPWWASSDRENSGGAGRRFQI